MNQLVTIPANGLEVLNEVRAAMNPVFAMMNLQVTAQPASCAAPPMLLHGLAAVEEIHAQHQSPERNEIGLAGGFYNQPFALEGSHRILTSFGRQFADLITGEALGSLFCHLAS
jgi:hypothetical protein